MPLAKASLAFNRLSSTNKVAFGANVVAQLTIAAAGTSNPFPSLPVGLEDLLDINNNLATAVSAMNQGGKNASAALKQAKFQWVTVFTVTANYVTTVAAGSETLIAASGFNSTKTTRSKKPVAGSINGFSAVVNHSKGAITVGAKNASVNAEGYLYAAVPGDVSVNYNGDIMEIISGINTIYIAASSRKQIDLTSMPKGKTYSLTMMAFNAAGTGPAAAPQEVIPQ